ncbi:MAG: hypothetical protein Q8R02_16450 [Hyphomonadaceae bacterium]|nr:hypothetical protein [Hyphomonadaceae bacterium]
MKSMFAAAGLAALMLGLGPAAQAQATYAAPKTSWGAPDIQGAWTNSSVTKLTRPAGVDKLVLTPAEAAAIENKDFNNARTAIEKQPTDQSTGAPEKGKALPSVGNYNAVWVDPGSKIATVKGELRSSWIVDPPNGRVPMSDAGRKKLATWRPDATRDGSYKPPADAPSKANAPAKTKTSSKAKTVAATGSAKPFVDLVEAPKSANGGGAASAYLGPESRGTGERCVVMGNAGGPVMLNGLYNNNFQVVQTPDHVIIVVEMIHDARIIPLVRNAAEVRKAYGPSAIARWLGDSIGWYEGDTLVIQSRNFHRQQAGQVFISDTGTLTERLTRISATDILYEFIVEDPEVYTQVWKGEISWRKIPGNVYEYACHEGNYGLFNILSGAREQERTGRALEATALEE